MRGFLTFVALICAAFSHAWGGLGHQVVSDLAWTDLQPSVKREIAKILLAGDPTYRPAKPTEGLTDDYLEKEVRPKFRQAALWPDDIKSPDRFTSPQYDDWVKRFNRESPGTLPERGGEEILMKTWHYYDVPLFDATGTKEARPSNAIRGLSMALAGFQNGKPKTQAFWLYWITHIVGDLHQPLHCCESFKNHPEGGDEGGNLFEVFINPSKADNTRRRLHGLWDGGVQDAVRMDQRFPANADLAIVSAAWKSDPFGPSEAEVSRLDPQEWVQDGAWLAETRVYAGVNPGGVVSDVYRSRLASLSKAQARLAGARLARMLNQVLGG